MSDIKDPNVVNGGGNEEANSLHKPADAEPLKKKKPKSSKHQPMDFEKQFEQYQRFQKFMEEVKIVQPKKGDSKPDPGEVDPQEDDPGEEKKPHEEIDKLMAKLATQMSALGLGFTVS